MGKTAVNSFALDAILVQLGDFGSYQKCVVGVLSIVIIFNSAVSVDYVFRAMDLEYRCRIYDCDHRVNGTTDYETPWLANAVPYVEGKPSNCYMYKKNYGTGCSPHGFNTSVINRCTSFIYRSPEWTLLQEYNLQCDDNLWKIPLVGTMNNLGQVFGMFISGFLSDRFGRKWFIICGTFLCSVSGLVRILIPTYEWHLVLEFMTAAFGSGIYMCVFVLGIELVTPKYRVLVGSVFTYCYPLGEIYAAVAAWLTQSWRPFSLTIYMPCIFALFCCLLIPESIRWNLSRGDVVKAEVTLREIADKNGVPFSKDSLELLISDNDENYDHKRDSILNALTSRKLILRIINCSFCWSTTTFLFYGLSLNSVTLVAGNSYLNFILVALVELPAYFVCQHSLRIYGRRNSLSAFFLITGLACLGLIFVSQESHVIRLVLYLLGKFGASASFATMFVVTSEIFPTSLRQTLFGTCKTFGRVGSVIAPQIPLMAKLWTPLPLLSFSGLSIIAAFLALLFPETLNVRLPDTVEEAENISKLPKE